MKKTIDIPDTIAEGKAVADIAKIFASLDDGEAVNRVAAAVYALCKFHVES